MMGITENSGGTENRRLGNLRPFPKGVSGNPGGRPPGLGALIRERTAGGSALVTYVLEVFDGKHGDDPKLRMDAATWLADRGFGKPVQTTELTGKDGAPLVPGWDLTRLTDEELADAERLAHRAAADA